MALDFSLRFTYYSAGKGWAVVKIADFASQYAQMSDDELLYLSTERESLVPEASIALDGELQRRGLQNRDAVVVRKRIDTLSDRNQRSLANQVVTAQIERRTRHFCGPEEPKFFSRYRSATPPPWNQLSDTWRGLVNVVDYQRHKYSTWKAFRHHTGYWPALSIWYHFLSWIAVVAVPVIAIRWVEDHRWNDWRGVVIVLGGFVFCLVLRNLGARLMRKLDWRWYGPSD